MLLRLASFIYIELFYFRASNLYFPDCRVLLTTKILSSDCPSGNVPQDTQNWYIILMLLFWRSKVLPYLFGLCAYKSVGEPLAEAEVEPVAESTVHVNESAPSDGRF